MKSLFDQDAYNEVLTRLDQLTPTSPRLWGKMNPAQMLAHCCEAYKVPLSKKPLKRMFLGRLLGGLLKHKLYNDTPWKQGLPTAPNFIIKEERDFEVEKAKFLSLAKAFYDAGPNGITKYPHPFFGTFTPDQWAKSMYKHIDHHLKQFSC
ncbi:MAG: DUF1569 domain-containing protein [Ferruginibacter sp.]